MKRNRQTYAENVFDAKLQKKLLPRRVYEGLERVRVSGGTLPQEHLDILAKKLSRWAISRGATRYVHLFCPLGLSPAGKRDGLCPPYTHFTATQLCSGEGDASSFPSGGICTAALARGLTARIPYAQPYVYGDCLYLPATLQAVHGEVLDTLTPLYRSQRALNRQCLRLLHRLGEHPSEVYAAVGAEQEYFLIDRATYAKRADLVYCGRTLFGALPPKRGQLFDGYLGAPDERIRTFWKEVDDTLWKLGIAVRSEHREVAPCQYELVPFHARADIAALHDCMIRRVLCDVAERQGLVCLLHEKPFDCYNGSGKHNNWSLMTDSGEALLELGDIPRSQARALLLISAVVKAVDEHSDLLCAAAASYGNDLRLGGMEAPPAVLSVYLGESLSRTIAYAVGGKWQCGKTLLPTMGVTERNRTSPFAFTGSKFEFRSVGSSADIAQVNTLLNTAVAESVRQFADRLEKTTDVYACVGETIAETFARHKRILYDGDNYSEAWRKEAKERRLRSMTALQAVEALASPHCVGVFERHDVLSRREISARRNVLLAAYADQAEREVLTALYLMRAHILADAEKYLCTVSEARDDVPARVQDIRALVKRGYTLISETDKALALIPTDRYARAHYCGESLLPLLYDLRKAADAIENLLPAEYLSLPTYGQMLFGAK